MNLQITTPTQKCMFNCSYCVAKGHKHKNQWEDITNTPWYWLALTEVLETYHFNTVVITGVNEPMQSCDFVQKVALFCNMLGVPVEIQTKYVTKANGVSLLNDIAYSIDNYAQLDHLRELETDKNIRPTVILADWLDTDVLQSVLNKIEDLPFVNQLTFKVLQNVSNNATVNDYINEHKLKQSVIDKLDNDIKAYKGRLSIRLDKDCMNADSRYLVFRENGQLYSDWGSTEPIE